MYSHTFVIKSLWVQNSIMLLSLGLLLLFLFYSIMKKKQRHMIAAIVWLGIVVWFFNSPFFGFSTVSVSPKGIKLNYGILSFKNDLLPISSHWEIVSKPSGIRKLKEVHFIRIANHESMKVRGLDDLNYLKGIGSAIDEFRK
jgi:hypothetical protein